MKPILRAIPTLVLTLPLLGCVDIKIPNKYKVDAEVKTPDLPKATANLEPAAKALDPLDIRGGRDNLAEKEKQLREKDEQIRKQAERIKELEAARTPQASQPQSSPAEQILKTLEAAKTLPEKITSARFNIAIYDDDKECGELVLLLHQGAAEVGRWSYGRGEDWNDPGSRSFTIQNLNIELNNQPLSMAANLQEHPGEVNIHAGLSFDLHFYTNRGRDIRFEGRHYYRTPRDSTYNLGGPR